MIFNKFNAGIKKLWTNELDDIYKNNTIKRPQGLPVSLDECRGEKKSQISSLDSKQLKYMLIITKHGLSYTS